MTRVLEIFGAGCAKCKALKTSTEKAVAELGWKNVEIIYNTDMTDIVKRGIITTPALAVNGEIVLAGHYLPPNKMIEILQDYEEISNTSRIE
jgi:small redox-active disulfide protein 2